MINKSIQILVPFLLLSWNSSGQRDIIGKATGSWVGRLKVQSIELTLVLTLSANEKDSITVTLDSPDQGAKDIPSSGVILTGDSLTVKFKAMAGSYLGRFDSGYSVLIGIWKQMGTSYELNLRHQEGKFALNRPQEPHPPYPYDSEEVTFKNPDAGITLKGTFTRPKGAGPFPAAVLVSGSGPQNRDEELMGHKPFLVLADHLARNGIAVLRYDDRGVGKSGGDYSKATTFDFASDAGAAVDFLKAMPGVDTLMTGIIGHSEGGIVAPVVASGRSDVAFLVLMAGTGLPGEQILLQQMELINRINGEKEEIIMENEKLSRQIYAVLKKYSDDETAAKKIRKLMSDFDKKHEKDPDYEKFPELQVAARIKSMTSPWFRTFLALDPQKYLSGVKCPVLALNGSLDLQVPAKENLEAIEKAFIFGGNSKYTIERVEGVNHLFQTATTGSPNEYGTIEETMAPRVLDLITGWILKTTE